MQNTTSTKNASVWVFRNIRKYSATKKHSLMKKHETICVSTTKLYLSMSWHQQHISRTQRQVQRFIVLIAYNNRSVFLPVFWKHVFDEKTGLSCTVCMMNEAFYYYYYNILCLGLSNNERILWMPNSSDTHILQCHCVRSNNMCMMKAQLLPLFGNTFSLFWFLFAFMLSLCFIRCQCVSSIIKEPLLLLRIWILPIISFGCLPQILFCSNTIRISLTNCLKIIFIEKCSKEQQVWETILGQIHNSNYFAESFEPIDWTNKNSLVISPSCLTIVRNCTRVRKSLFVEPVYVSVKMCVYHSHAWWRADTFLYWTDNYRYCLRFPFNFVFRFLCIW